MVGVRPEHFTPHGKVKLNVNVDLIEDLGGTSFAMSARLTARR